VPPEGFWIGREPPAQVVVPDAEISRLHCWVGPRVGAVAIVDSESSNGTLVMGEPVGDRVLRDGDVVVLARGAASFRFERAREETAAP
jgi:pSer/pThr/pTyr-binding forkhead associated (FHA) protein